MHYTCKRTAQKKNDICDIQIEIDDNLEPRNANDLSTTNEVAEEEQISQNDATTELIGTNSKTPASNGEHLPVLPQCSWMPDHVQIPSAISNPTSFPTASPQHVLPIPKVEHNKKRTSRKKGKTAILTLSPYFEELKKAKEETKTKAAKKVERVKRKVSFSKDGSKATKEKVVKKKRVLLNKGLKVKTRDSDSSDTEDDAECLYCQDFYSTSNEGWVACSSCCSWAHNSCADVHSEDDESVFICELCVN
ncbi:PHD finger protein 13-like [Diabrotica virgifera virgifera]|uniref:Zinc finger PHD-type domain-containing protein n=1 Tax=Diabrotica virgifera virgifera TaxID=50390 RepID=A0ABM5JZZ3_DIAVI|nr:PHD finger protein 13-like [Diabrotica virgifera virgifera]